MNLLDVIKRPVITEKSMLAMDDKKYTFEVDTRANKTLVKQAVEAAFDVKVKREHRERTCEIQTYGQICRIYKKNVAKRSLH